MSDSTLVRQLAGATFRRADTRRDERAAAPRRPVEDALRDLAGWLPPGRDSGRSIRRLHGAVSAVAADLHDQPDAVVRQRFDAAVMSLKAAAAGAAPDLQRLPAVLACVTEACRRTLRLTPHPVQLAGARALLRGQLAEMQTGEGKTLVAAIAATAMAGAGAAVHVISTNDYLARRDCTEMTPLFAFFGIDAGFIDGSMDGDTRRLAYARTICYAAGKEVVFDYLKDRLQRDGTAPASVSRLHDLLAAPQATAGGSTSTAGAATRSTALIPALHFAIVDEADSVLIDEARTPMILSRESPPVFAAELLGWAIDAARSLQPGAHFRLDAARQLELLPAAPDHCPPLPASVAAVWRARAWREHLLRQALTALHLYHRDQHYIVVDDKVQIVDESTGRVMPDRSWEQGLHQLIETKENLAPTNGRETLARMTYQRFFRRYYLLSGLTGTASDASRELWRVYRLRVRRIPPDRPKRQTRRPDRCLPTLAAKWAAVADTAVAAAARGQPVLVGTRSVRASESVAAELQRRGIAHVVLNARQDADEAAIVAQAGTAGRIMVATNMAGRGTDIRPDAAALRAGGLLVILTEYHESPRIDRQLFGRSARQGEPGTVCAIVSAEDTLFGALPRAARTLLATVGVGNGDGVVLRALLRIAVAQAQQRAERLAGRARHQTMRQDNDLHRLIGFAGRVT